MGALRQFLLRAFVALAFLAPIEARADSTLAAMPAATTLGGSELFYCVQSNDAKCTATQIGQFALTSALSTASSWAALQTYGDGYFALAGSTSGAMKLHAPAVAGTYSINFPAANDTLAALGISQTFTGNNSHTGTETFSGSTSVPAAIATNIGEPGNTSGTALSGSTAATIYLSTASIYNYTSNPTAAYVVNVAWSSGTSYNTAISTGVWFTVTWLVNNGSTAYLPSAYQVDGSAITCNWQGGSAPSAADASVIDVFTMSILKTASATYTVLCSMNKF